MPYISEHSHKNIRPPKYRKLINICVLLRLLYGAYIHVQKCNTQSKIYRGFDRAGYMIRTQRAMKKAQGSRAQARDRTRLDKAH